MEYRRGKREQRDIKSVNESSKPQSLRGDIKMILIFSRSSDRSAKSERPDGKVVISFSFKSRLEGANVNHLLGANYNYLFRI